MTYELKKLKREHIVELLKDDINNDVRIWMKEDLIDKVMEFDFNMSLFYKDELMAVFGTQPCWLNRAYLWAIFSKRCKKNFLPVFRGMKRYLEYQPFKRAEVCVRSDFKLGRRRMELLGFKLECSSAESYMPNGDSAALYSYVRTNGSSF